jgi:hypothetical protein
VTLAGDRGHGPGRALPAALGVFFPKWGPVAELGEGGIERWIVYPVVLWLVAFGSWLLGGRGRQREIAHPSGGQV